MTIDARSRRRCNLRIRRHKAAGMFLAAACSSVALLSPADKLYGATFTFTTAAGDWIAAHDYVLRASASG